MRRLIIFYLISVAGCSSGTRTIPKILSCDLPLTKENLTGNWAFEFRGYDGKKRSIGKTPILIRYDYAADGAYKFYYKKVLADKSFDFLPMDKWVEIESGKWKIDGTSILHTEKTFTEYHNNDDKGDHSFRIKSLCKDYLVAFAFNNPQNQAEKEMLNYFKREP